MGFDDTWADADPDQGGNDNPPDDGIHDVALVDARAFTSKGGDDTVVFEWRTVDGDYSWSQVCGFKSPKAAGFTKGQCITAGVDVDSVGSLDELDAALKECVAGFYEVEVQRNGEFVNTYIRGGQKPSQPDVPADTAGLQPAAASKDDDVPF
jgi:hypothetical protein